MRRHVSASVYAEYAVVKTGRAIMPASNRAVTRPYVLNGGLLVTRKVTVTPAADSGTATYTYGPWRQIRTAGALA